MLVCAATIAGAADPKAARLYEDALARFDKKDIPGAIVQLKSALQIDRSMLPVHVLLGRALQANGELAAAEVAFNEALTLGVNRAEVVLPLARTVVGQGRPRDVIDQAKFASAGLPAALQAQLLLVKAGASADLGDTKAALKSIEESRALEPASPDSWTVEVPLRIRLRQVAEAQAAADKALALAPKSPDALYLRGSVLHVRGDLAGALSAYDKALQAQPAFVEALVSRAGLLLDQGKVADALKDVETLLATSPKEPRARYLRALIAETQRDAATARASLTDVTALLDPVPIDFFRYRPQFLMLGGLAHYGLNEKEKAKPYLEAVQRIQPGSPATKVLAQIQLSEKSYDRAIESLDGYLRSQPNDVQAIHLLASAHMAQGRHARAAQLIQDALKVKDQPALRTMLGLSLINAGKLGNAVGELEAAIKKDPGQIQAGTALATIYMQTGQGALAVRIAEGLLKQQPQSPGLLNLAGMARLSANDAAGARNAFEQASKLDAKFTAPQVNLARMDRVARAYDKAITRLDAVLKADDKQIDALSELGIIYELAGRPADAQRFLEKAADLSGPQELQQGLTLVDFHLRRQQPDLAREATKRLTGKAPDEARVLIAQARVDLAAGDKNGAKTFLTRASNTANYDAGLLVGISQLQLQAGNLPGAAYSLEKALGEQPEHLGALAMMTDVEVLQGELAKAEKRARGIIAKYPKLAVGYSLMGDVSLARKDKAGAVDNYRRAHQIAQSTDSVMRLHAMLQSTDPKGATQLVDGWIKSHPGDVAVRRTLADGHARSGNYPAARTAYEALLKATPDDPDVLNNLANVLLLQGENAAALKLAQTALAKEPNRANIIATAGWALFKNGQTDQALQLLRNARLRDPNNPDVRYYLGAVLASLGRKGEARDELQGAFALTRDFGTAKQAEALLTTLK